MEEHRPRVSEHRKLVKIFGPKKGQSGKTTLFARYYYDDEIKGNGI
jgi:hypothetical protein